MNPQKLDALPAPDTRPDLRRIRAFAAVIGMGLLALLARLWYLQVALGEDLFEASEGNRTRLIRRVAPRGQILDRKGRVLATNRQQIVVSVVPYELRRNPDTLARLAALLETSAAELEETIRDKQATPFDPVRIAVGVDMAIATRIEERRAELPGVQIGPEPVRYYPDGPLFGHVLGQLGQISPEELKARRGEGYFPGDFCGKLGLERAYDSALKGTDGGREVEVDAHGRIRRELRNTDPLTGATLILSLDRDVQKTAYDALAAHAAKGHPGAAVALDPNTGAVIALASFPSYDPNLFVNGISRTEYRKLQEDPLLPQINRAISSATAPGSTFKIVTAAAGLELGRTSLGDTAYCPGVLYLGRWPKRCHKHSGHGSVDLTAAMARSCDVFFYRLGLKLGPDRMAEYAKRFGLGRTTRIDIVRPNDIQIESAGTVPDPQVKRRVRREEWVGGDTVDFAIGQSMLQCTPLQMCNAMAAVANGGTLYRPALVREVKRGAGTSSPANPEPLGRLGLKPATLETLVHCIRAVMLPGGTAHASAIPGVAMAGKTGTAQSGRRGRTLNSAWFVCYAPLEKPRIAVCVYVQHGGHGGEIAAPIARRMIEAYLGIRSERQTRDAPRTED